MSVRRVLCISISLLLPMVVAFSPASTRFFRIAEGSNPRADRVHSALLYRQSQQRRLELQASKSKHIRLPKNEFSRTMQPDRILRIKRDYVVDVEATKEECDALAERFELSDIAKLSATLILRQERLGAKSGTSGVEVEGTVVATVTQTCVRTNEDFQVDLEFPLYSIVRPVLPVSAMLQDNSQEDYHEDRSSDIKPRKTSYRGQDRNIDDMDLMELQRMLQQDISAEDDILMEDESIYPIDGLLDVGELVAQLFWLKLDPYPKKPGTNPVQRSISSK